MDLLFLQKDSEVLHLSRTKLHYDAIKIERVPHCLRCILKHSGKHWKTQRIIPQKLYADL